MTNPMLARIEQAEFAPPYGHVSKIASGLIEATGPAGRLGDLCEVEAVVDMSGAPRFTLAEITAVDERRITLVPFDPRASIAPGARVSARAMRDRVKVGNAFAGRAIDALGQPIDGGGAIVADQLATVHGLACAPLERANPAHSLATGIRAMDGLLTLGRGQRIGVFAASGVGKTTLLEQLTAQIDVKRCILCLVGERGREVESIWRNLSGRDDAARFTLVAATSDESAALRARAVNQALCLAEHWRDQNEDVLLMVDSVTRLAMALREIGLAAGAPPTVRAYTPNVFSALPKLVERCGVKQGRGAITAIITVLSETDDVDDPIVELMKSLLDGHVILSRSLAEQGHFPAIDVVRSVSRGAERLVAADHAKAMRDAVATLAAYEEARIMIETGAYRAGTNPLVDRAIGTIDRLNAFLRQPTDERAAFDDTVLRLREIMTGGAT